MIVFRVTQNINIKTTDGTLVKYHRFKRPFNQESDSVYISTYDDFEDLKTIFEGIDKKRYLAKNLTEDALREFDDFPKELGISNISEYSKLQEINKNSIENYTNNEDFLNSFLLNNNNESLEEQVRYTNREKISVVLIGGVGKSISEILSSLGAIRILKNYLLKFFKEVNIDIYISASNNSFYSRDKQIYKTQDYIREVYPLSISIKEFMKYDYFCDNSSFLNTVFYKKLNHIDAWLYKFGIDYKKIDDSLKYNQFDLANYTPNEELKQILEEEKAKSKLLLFHPYSANIKKSIPQVYATAILKDLVKKSEDYIVVSTLKIDGKFSDNRYLDLSKYSKNLNDFIYIISNMNSVISVDTATYHISDAFMIPTIVLFENDEYIRKIKYYNFVKAVRIKDKIKDMSKFIFQNEELLLYKFESWKNFKVKKIIKLLEKF